MGDPKRFVNAGLDKTIPHIKYRRRTAFEAPASDNTKTKLDAQQAPPPSHKDPKCTDYWGSIEHIIHYGIKIKRIEPTKTLPPPKGSAVRRNIN